MAHVIGQRMTEIIFRSTGLTIDQISAMRTEDTQATIENLLGHKLDDTFSSGDDLVDLDWVGELEGID